MKFKVFSALLLGLSFLALGVLAGAIPVMGMETAQAAAPAAETVPPDPTPGPAVSPSPSPSPPEETPAVSPTATVPPEAEPEQGLWQPDAAVVATTITWSDPVKNEAGYEVDGQALLEQPPALTLPREGPQILIIHTHATEAYTPEEGDGYPAEGDYHTADADHSVIRVGQALAEALEGYGLRVLHDTGQYDLPGYNGSYARSEQAIREHLAAEPGIAMVIDLHRDALGDESRVYKTLSDETDAPAAQLMFVMGTDRNLEHPAWRENLALALSLQGLTERQYPHLMRPTLLSSYRYNQQLTTGSLLLEVGTAGNTLQEAITAVELFADAVGPSLAALAEDAPEG